MILSSNTESFEHLDDRIDVLTKECTEELHRQGFEEYVDRILWNPRSVDCASTHNVPLETICVIATKGRFFKRSLL